MEGMIGDVTGDTSQTDGTEDQGSLPPSLARLEAELLKACARPVEWPAQIAAGVYAGVDFAIANPTLMEATLTVEFGGMGEYERVVERLSELIRLRAPVERRLPGSTDRALVASILGLVGDHVRVGRLDRLAELRPELVLLTLLPYLGFSEAQRWANQAAH